jgi:hypothetical protein
LTVDRKALKYLERQGEPEAGLADELGGPFGDVLALPVYGEGDELRALLTSLPGSPAGELLIVVVVNAREDSPEWVHAANASTLRWLGSQFGGSELEAGARNPQGAQLFAHPRGKLLLLDRAGPGRFLPARQGVGLARKIASDLALRLALRGALRTRWLHWTDADAALPDDYFERSHARPFSGVAALLYPFLHLGNSSQPAGRAVYEYEASLRYHVLGLRYAGSRYAFHTIGSTLAVDLGAYARVRGVPRRSAAEDFYLLNKLAKVGGVRTLAGEPIALSGRVSERVPFGTGRAIGLGVEMIEQGGGRSLYHPVLFAYLRAWLRALDAVADRQADEDLRAAVLEHARGPAELDPELLVKILDESGAFAAVHHAVERRSSSQTLRKHLDDHFDAFFSLKLLHALREHHPSLPLVEALERAPFVDVPSHGLGPDALCRELARQESSSG